MRADLRLGQIRSGQMKKDLPISESGPLKVHISEIITALCAALACFSGTFDFEIKARKI